MELNPSKVLMQQEKKAFDNESTMPLLFSEHSGVQLTQQPAEFHVYFILLDRVKLTVEECLFRRLMGFGF